MRTFFRLILLVFTASWALTASAQMPNPVSWTSSVKNTGNANEYEVTFSAKIEAPWYMYDLGPYDGAPYETSFDFGDTDAVELVGDISQMDPPIRKRDEIFGKDIGYSYGEAAFVQKVLVKSASPVEWEVTVDFQVCNEESCLAPAQHTFTIKLEGAGQGVSQADTEGGRSMWSIILEAILWGFAALLTPCVFPMVPMTVSFFMKVNEGKNKQRGRFMASLFGLSIVALYTIPIAIIILITFIAGGEVVTASIFNWFATHWLPNVIFFIVFILFAASFFGAFELRLPGKLVNKSESKADKGGILGVFFMALTLVLVSFSCTGPIVGSILIKSTQGAIWEPIITMLAFSVAFAIPFAIFAFFPALLDKLPKSGGWLNSVKVVLGFLELALGLKFLSVADQVYHWGILDREVYLALWIVIFALLGFYLLGKIRFKYDSDVKYIGVGRLSLAIITFAFVVYMIPGMWGAPLKVLSGYIPPLNTQDFVIGESSGVTSTPPHTATSPRYNELYHLPYGLTGYFEYEEGLAASREAGKPVFLNYTGLGCVNCREMEARVWSDPEVLRILKEDYVLVSLYGDDKKRLPESEWTTTPEGKIMKSIGQVNSYITASRFGINTQPSYIVLDGKGNMLLPPRGYNLNISAYIDFLKQGVAKFNRSK